MTILVTGATGFVGRHLTTWLVEHGHRVRALTRRPAGAHLPDGVQVVGGDLGEPPGGLFDDVDRVFVFPAADGVDEFVQRAAAAGVRRLVVLSSLAAAQEHPRDAGSASATHHLAVEKSVAAVTADWTFLRPGTFASNLLTWAPLISRGLAVRAPYLDSAQAPVHEADVAGAAGFLLTSEGHAGKAYPLTGPQALTRREQVAVIAAAVGREIELVEITPDEFRQEAGPWIPAPVMTMLLDYWRDTTTEPDVPRDLSTITGTPGRTLQQWAHDHREDFD